jgi:tetratricopeptide (TPR) repeat protein
MSSTMKKKYLLVLIISIASLKVFSQIEPRAGATWQVKKYDISASTSDRSLNAKATLSLQNIGTASGSRLTLRISPKAEIIEVRVSDSLATFTKGEEKIGATTNLQRIFVSLPSIQPLGLVTVTVDYKLKVDENSGLQAITPVSTQFLPQSFWYPTPNSWFAPKGGDFAPVNLKINSTDTIITSQNANLSGQPFFLTGSWDTIESQGISVFLPKGASADERKRGEELAAITTSAKTFVAALLGETNTKFKLVAVRRGSGFSDSGTILLDYAAFRRQKIDAQTVMTITESVAKNWIGNSKLITDEGNGVIREGLSRFIANEFLEKQYGKAVADNERYRQRVSYANIAKNETPITIATPLDSSFYVVSANKGAILWRLMATQIGYEAFFKSIREKNNLSLNEIRSIFPNLTELLEYSLKNSNDTNLLVGLPQVNGAVTKVAVRNTGSIKVETDVVAITENGQKLTQKIVLEQKSFGEVLFSTTAKIVRTEVDQDKIYPQTDYSDDVAPREFQESNPISSIKRAYDKQDFVLAEKYARTVLTYLPNLDEVRTWLGRSLLSQNRLSDAEKEFNAALAEKLPMSGTLAWANLGLAELMMKNEQKANVLRFLDYSIISEGEYGANLSARLLRQKTNTSQEIDESIKSFFIDFDKSAISGRKTEVESFIAAGEIVKFGSGVSAGQPEKWETKVIRTEKVDTNHATVEASLTVKRLGVEALETGNAVFLLVKTGNRWKLSGIEIFEVR